MSNLLKRTLPILSNLTFVCCLLTTCVLTPRIHAQTTDAPQENFVKSHYTKYEYRIPMRDGKKLFTAVYVPKQSAFPADPGPYPIMMDRTPYSVGPYGEERRDSLAKHSQFRRQDELRSGCFEYRARTLYGRRRCR